MKGVLAFHNRAVKYPASQRENEAGKTCSLTNDALTRHLHHGEPLPRERIILYIQYGLELCQKQLSGGETVFLTYYKHYMFLLRFHPPREWSVYYQYHTDAKIPLQYKMYFAEGSPQELFMKITVK